MGTSDIIAIDILLEPDARMLAHAESNNARLRLAFPDGFALDAEHRPHITLLQCFVSATNLEALCNAAGDVSTGVAPTDYLDRMIAEPFAAFAFAPAGSAVYQLGTFGTAARRLKRWEVTT